MYSIQYVNALNTEDAVKKMEESEDGKLLAGGMTLIPTLKQRLASPDRLVDLSSCNLSNITNENKSILIGSMTCHDDVASSQIIKKDIPALSKLAGNIGDRQVRNRGTIGGSLANNDPAACYPAAVLALDATIITQKRLISAKEFFVGMFETLLDENEVIVAVRLPKPDKAAYFKFPNPASRYALVGVFVAKFDKDVRVAVTGAGEEGVFRSADLEKALGANFSPECCENISFSADTLMSDIHATADYRAHLICEMTRRAVIACCN